MNSSAGTFKHGRLELFHRVWGSGPHVLIAFHGYGRTHADFEEFVEPWSHIFTVYAFDLPFHGRSKVLLEFADKQPLEAAELADFFASFLQNVGADEARLLGYSIGGRVALKLTEELPDKIKGLYLFAPDGLKPNPGYVFLSETTLGRWVFRALSRHHAVFFRLMDLALRINWVDRKTHGFITSQVATGARRKLVYDTWTFLRKIKPNRRNLLRTAKEHDITLDFFFGRYDKIIPVKNASAWVAPVSEGRLNVLETGHAMLTPSIARFVLEDNRLHLPIVT